MRAADRRQRLEQIKGYAITLAQAVLVMDERRHILEPLLKDDSVRSALHKKFKKTYGAHAYNHLAPLMAQDLLRDLARLFLDSDRRAGSLINLYRKASAPAIRCALKQKFAEIPDKWNNKPGSIGGLSESQSAEIRKQFRDKDRKEYEESFEEGWESAVKAVKDLAEDPVAAKIKTFRDKYHAHLQMTPLGQDPGPFDLTSSPS